MEDHIRFVGLDVHAATIAVAVAEANGNDVRIRLSLVRLGLKRCRKGGPFRAVLRRMPQ